MAAEVAFQTSESYTLLTGKKTKRDEEQVRNVKTQKHKKKNIV